MAVGQIPSWISSKPSDFVDAAATGASLGLKKSAQADDAAAAQARIALAGQQLAQETMADQARLVMAGQQLAAAEKQTALESKINQEKAQKDFLYRQQRDSMTDAYRMATIGMAKTKLEDAAKQSAMVGAHKQGFAQAIAAGISPAEAAAKYPLAMTAGIATQIAKPKTEATNTETVTERYPGVDPVEASSGFFGIGARPATPGTPAKTISYKRPREGVSQIPESLKTNTASVLRFIRDAKGKLVPETK